MDPICNSGPHTIRHAFDRPDIWNCPWALAQNIMPQICTKLGGRHDFTCFVHKSERKKKINVIDLEKFCVKFTSESTQTLGTSNDEVNVESSCVIALFILEAKGFRRSMVRNLIGFLVDISRGLCKVDDVNLALSGVDDGANIINAVPACGLCLEKVQYNDSIKFI